VHPMENLCSHFLLNPKRGRGREEGGATSIHVTGPSRSLVTNNLKAELGILLVGRLFFLVSVSATYVSRSVQSVRIPSEIQKSKIVRIQEILRFKVSRSVGVSTRTPKRMYQEGVCHQGVPPQGIL